MMKFVCLLTKEYNIPTVVSMNPIMIDGTGMELLSHGIGDSGAHAAADDGHAVEALFLPWSA